MADYFEFSSNRIYAERAGRVILDTDKPMLNLVPDAKITLDPYSISFPDFWKGSIYYQWRSTAGGFDSFACQTWVGLVEQEWGPSAPSPYTLTDIPVGTVPSGTNYLEIWVNLTRTVSPGNILDLPLSSSFPENRRVKLDGLSCVLEEFGGVARQFEFVLSGTSVSLRRRQSVNKNGGIVQPPVSRVNPSGGLGNVTYFYPGTNAPVDAAKFATHGQLIDQKGPSGGDTHRPAGKEQGSANNTPCSMNMSGISYASTWTGTIEITPGRLT